MRIVSPDLVPARAGLMSLENNMLPRNGSDSTVIHNTYCENVLSLHSKLGTTRRYRSSEKKEAQLVRSHWIMLHQPEAVFVDVSGPTGCISRLCWGSQMQLPRHLKLCSQMQLRRQMRCALLRFRNWFAVEIRMQRYPRAHGFVSRTRRKLPAERKRD